MSKRRSWTDKQLVIAVRKSKSYRAVIIEIGLIPAGGNYQQVKQRVKELMIDTGHFTGKAWNKGMTYSLGNKIPTENLLVKEGKSQSYKLKKRLFNAGLKLPKCELCGWCEKATDGRIPVELDHINGNRNDNRLSNLRVLCPNCHSLQPTHRGKNKRVKLARVVE